VRRRGRKGASSVRDERGVEGLSEKTLRFEVVRRIRRVCRAGGRREDIEDVRSDTVDVDGRGIERTEGKERPGKEVRRTLMFAMVVTAVSIRRALM
jgi:hypothetical protein